MVHRGHAFFLSCCGLVLTLFLWYDFGPVETVKNVYVFVSNTKNLQLPASAHEGMEDAQVGDREPHATTDRNKGTRTTAMTIQVDLSSLKPARKSWGEKSRVAQNRADVATRVRWSASSAERPYPTFSEPSSRTRAGFDRPAPIV